MIAVKTGTLADVDWLCSHEHGLTKDHVTDTVVRGEYLVATLEQTSMGLLRFSWFWREIPYMEFVHVLPDSRRRGIGSALLSGWESRMRAAGATLLMTSSVESEIEPQAWHRRNGYAPSGALRFAHLQSEPEVFFLKSIG